MALCMLGQLRVFLAALIVASVVAATPVFVQKPNDTVVMEGDTAVLMCSVANLREGFEVRWENNRKGTLATNRTVLGEYLEGIVEPSRYSIVGNSSVGEFNLQIKGADITDADQYTCEICDTSGRIDRTVTSTPKAELIIDSSPTGYYPKCRPSTLKNYYLEGDRLEANCIFRNAHQMPELQWYKSGKSLNGHRLYNSIADVTYQWPLRAHDNGANITCMANETLQCNVGPVEVYFKPRPAMVSANVEVTVGDSAVFKVIGDWNPAPSSYSWSVTTGNVDNSLKTRFFESGSTLTISDTQPQDDNVSVSCVVTNSVGNARAHAKLRVRPSPVHTIYTTDIRRGNELISTVSPQNDRPFSSLVIVILAVGSSMFLIAIGTVIFYFTTTSTGKKRYTCTTVQWCGLHVPNDHRPET